MAGDQVKLLHSAPQPRIGEVVREELKASSAFDDLGPEMRREVVFCWLKKEHGKMRVKSPDHPYVEVCVDRSRCR